MTPPPDPNPVHLKKYLDLWQIEKTFPTPTGPSIVVQGFDLAIAQGEFVCLIGHSGCGKSTVLSMVAGLTAATSGTIILAGREVRGPGTDRGVVFQAPCLFDWMTALENVTLGIEQAFPNKNAKERNELAAFHLEQVGLGDALDKRPAELSQGMRQRVGLARAFALEPKMLLLDEPFGMLDSLTRLELQGVLLDIWQTQRITALMVTHDVDEALFLSDRVAMMTSGPNAKLGAVLEVPFERPRSKTGVLDHPQYYALRDELIGFLEGQEHGGSKPKEPDASGEPTKADDEDVAVSMALAG
jgi:nitrate/nitrite transport system ATP-binding protein